MLPLTQVYAWTSRGQGTLGLWRGRRHGFDRVGGRVNKVASETLHGQLSSYIRSQIYEREWIPSQRIPSEHELMNEFDVSRGTVRKALKTLVDEGLLQQEHGRGTYVSQPNIAHPGGDEQLSFAASLEGRGIEFTTKVMHKERIEANADVSAKLRIDVGDPVLKVRRLRADGHGNPIMVLDGWMPLNVCPGLEKMPLETMSMFDAVEQCTGCKIAYAQMAYSARTAGKEVARELQVNENAPILNLEQIICLEDGRPVEWSDTMFCAGQTIMGTALRRDLSA